MRASSLSEARARQEGQSQQDGQADEQAAAAASEPPLDQPALRGLRAGRRRGLRRGPRRGLRRGPRLSTLILTGRTRPWLGECRAAPTARDRASGYHPSARRAAVKLR